uniref:Uncharacterized protein n=1 Tax=Acrobeloides nanus TaxID=290746 RepID=A0A914CF32_9BILA
MHLIDTLLFYSRKIGAAMKKPLNKNNKVETKSLVIPKYSSSRRNSTKSSRSSLSSFRRSKVVAAAPFPSFKGQAFLTPTYEDPRKAIEEFRSITPIMEITDTEEHCEINQMWQRILDVENYKSTPKSKPRKGKKLVRHGAVEEKATVRSGK